MNNDIRPNRKRKGKKKKIDLEQTHQIFSLKWVFVIAN